MGKEVVRPFPMQKNFIGKGVLYFFMNKAVKRIVCFSVMAVVIIALAIGNVVAGIYNQQITNFLVGTGEDFSEASEVLQESDQLVRTLAEDSIVLLKNQEDADGEPALPLTEADEESEGMCVNLFGVSAYDPNDAASFDGFLMKGIGSGSSTILESKAVTLTDALDEYGIHYNTDLASVYENFNYTRSASNPYVLSEPSIGQIQAEIPDAMAYSDIAIVVLSRLGGENVGEQPKTQSGNSNKTYLEISDAEEELLQVVTQSFGKVIVILNTANIMHCGFLEDENIDAAMYVGLTGQSGAIAIPEILLGERTYENDEGQTVTEEFSPSGKVSDTYIYTPDYDPSYANTESSSGSNGIGTTIQYSEDIYFGYKWYETADAEGYFNNVSNEYGTGYDAVVQYPFGYGLSYTEFDWEIKDISMPGGVINEQNKNEEITITVHVTNKGDYAGKDVVELYYTPDYISGEVEKAEVNLLDFGKTTLLQPGEGADVELSFTPYDMASFDDLDKNHNGHYGYELDTSKGGSYKISLRTDSHTVKTGEDTYEYEYTLDGDILYTEDPETGETVEPRFTDAGDYEAYAGVPIDGSNVGVTQSYLSRQNFSGTFPTTKAAAPTNASKIQSASQQLEDAYNTDTMPTMGQVTTDDGQPLKLTNGTEYNWELFEELIDYDNPLWEDLLNQITASELLDLVNVSAFRIDAIDSVGSPDRYDYDGPAGFNINSQVGGWGGSTPTGGDSWTAFPCECLLGCSWNKLLLLQMGLSMGAEASATNLDGWYAPGVNLHRTNYTSRNYEYYSEDAVLTGKLAAQVVHGAKINGLYCYIKHFVVSESGPNGKAWNTWLTEQNLRENYLKPFELAVKEGGSNAVMSSFNRLGCVWTGANYALLTDILRGEWGFRGSVITDWYDGGAADLGKMPPKQGIRAGNDIWLAFQTTANAVSSSDPTDMACARRAAKNVLYTMIDTVYYNANFDSSELEGMLTVEKTVSTREGVFPWWIPVLVTVDVLVLAGFGVWTFFLLKPKKEQNETNAQEPTV